MFKAVIFKKMALLGATALLLGACNQLANEARTLKEAAKRAQYDALQEWKGLLIYEPPPQSQLAQRRYCYKQLADIVCYDAPQSITSPITGIQEGLPGRMIPGKAALEAYEANKANVFYEPDEAISTAPVGHVLVTAPAPIDGAVLDLSAPDGEALQGVNIGLGADSSENCPSSGPFACGESTHIKKN